MLSSARDDPKAAGVDVLHAPRGGDGNVRSLKIAGQQLADPTLSVAVFDIGGSIPFRARWRQR